MTSTEQPWQIHAAQLAEQLLASEDIRDLAWARAVACTPRHVLVPTVYEQQPDGSWQRRDANLAHTYSPVTLITAVEDGLAVSSSTKPDLMVRMLEALDIQPGQRVLEIGTGTGYNAALLAHRLGEDSVYSVDVDQELVELARQRLAKIGLHPHLAAADGASGWPANTSFDRIIATCSVHRVPWAWAEQLNQGGKLLVDVKFGSGAGNLTLLDRRSDRLEGHFTGRWAAFMTIRPVEPPPAQPRLPRASYDRERFTTAPAQPWNSHREVWLLACLRLPAAVVRGFVLDPANRAPKAATLAALDGSWCEVDLQTGVVREAGPTRLWAPVELAFDRWQSWGEPSWERFGLTVTPSSHRLWLDDPENVVTELTVA